MNCSERCWPAPLARAPSRPVNPRQQAAMRTRRLSPARYSSAARYGKPANKLSSPVDRKQSPTRLSHAHARSRRVRVRGIGRPVRIALKAEWPANARWVFTGVARQYPVSRPQALAMMVITMKGKISAVVKTHCLVSRTARERQTNNLPGVMRPAGVEQIGNPP